VNGRNPQASVQSVLCVFEEPILIANSHGKKAPLIVYDLDIGERLAGIIHVASPTARLASQLL